MIPDGFFFLRPLWLLLIVPLILLISVLLHRSSSSDGGAWRYLVEAHLLKHLAVQRVGTTNSRWLLAALGAGLLAAVIAMAGPTWQKTQMPSFKPADPVVILLSLAQSMNATDVSPSRLVRASHKVRDILSRSKSGDIGFIVYSDRPFVAAPLTSDVGVIEEMLPELSPDLMPVLGNRLDIAIKEAGDLLVQSGEHRGKIIVIADDAGNRQEKSLAAAKQMASKGYRVSVLGVGTLKGATLQTSSGQVIRDGNNKPIITRLAATELAELARAGDGQYVRLSPGNADIDQLFPLADKAPGTAAKVVGNRHMDAWKDMGYWLLFVPVLLAPLAFRRGLLMLLPLTFALVSIPHSQNVEAAWADLWETPDQQAFKDFKQGDFPDAAGTFQNPDWKASALYKSGQYDKAASLFSGADDLDHNFNLGNSLAHMGEYEKAINAYDKALESNPKDADAKFNRDLVAKLLEQQNKSKEESQTQDDQQNAEQDKQGGGQAKDGDNQQGEQQASAGQGQTGEPDGESGDQQSADGQGGQAGEQSESLANSTAGGEKTDPEQQGLQPTADEAGQNNNLSETASAQPGDKQDSPQTTKKPSNTDQVAGESSDPDNSTKGGATVAADKSNQDEKSAFRKAMDALMQGNGEADDTDEQTTSAEIAAGTDGITEQEQTREQLLRAVPDDSSGLLKARIRQHYQRLRGAQQNG